MQKPHVNKCFQWVVLCFHGRAATCMENVDNNQTFFQVGQRWHFDVRKECTNKHYYANYYFSHRLFDHFQMRIKLKRYK